jgi:hypothetical protein
MRMTITFGPACVYLVGRRPMPARLHRVKTLNPNKTKHYATKITKMALFVRITFPAHSRPLHNKNLYLTVLAFPKLSS